MCRPSCLGSCRWSRTVTDPVAVRGPHISESQAVTGAEGRGPAGRAWRGAPSPNERRGAALMGPAWLPQQTQRGLGSFLCTFVAILPSPAPGEAWRSLARFWMGLPLDSSWWTGSPGSRRRPAAWCWERCQQMCPLEKWPSRAKHSLDTFFSGASFYPRRRCVRAQVSSWLSWW